MKQISANRVRTIMASFATGGVLAAQLVSPPTAQASPMSYLNALEQGGIEVYDPGQAVRYGWAMCNELNYTTGDVVAERVFVNTSWAEVPDVATAAFMVVTAVEQLCPWHDHRGELA